MERMEEYQRMREEEAGRPVPAELDESLRPFVLYYPGWSADDQVPAAELCSRLGAGCHWDREAGTVTITYRGHTAVLTVGTEELVVDGAEEMTFGPTVERDGQVYLNWKVCDYLEIPCQSRPHQRLVNTMARIDATGIA